MPAAPAILAIGRCIDAEATAVGSGGRTPAPARLSRARIRTRKGLAVVGGLAVQRAVLGSFISYAGAVSRGGGTAGLYNVGRNTAAVTCKGGSLARDGRRDGYDAADALVRYALDPHLLACGNAATLAFGLLDRGVELRLGCHQAGHVGARRARRHGLL